MDTTELLSRKHEMIETARRAFAAGLQTNSGGNLSVRLESAAAIVITPSGIGFADCNANNLLVISLDGAIIEGDLKPSKDLAFHLEIFAIRPDLRAIVHVHSPWATGWAAAGRPVPCVTVHSKSKLNRIPLVPCAPGGKPQGPAEVRTVIRETDVFGAVFENHGTLGLGKNLQSALNTAELIEETAHIATVKAIVSATDR